MSENTSVPFYVYAYVDPQSGEATSLYAAHLIGTSKRIDGTWKPVFDAETVADDTEGKSVYELNWDRDYDDDADVDGMSDDEIWATEDEHQAISMFDEGQLDAAAVQKYFDLVSDGVAPDVETEKP